MYGQGRCSIRAVMPVEFALRPRIRLREDRPRPRRPRVPIPKYALPVAAYWLAMAGVTYAFVRQHESPRVVDDSAPLAEPAAPGSRAWWQPLSSPVPAAAPQPEPVPTPPSVPLTTSDPIIQPPTEPALEREASPPEPSLTPPSRVSQDDSLAHLAARERRDSVTPPARSAPDSALSELPAVAERSLEPLAPPTEPPAVAPSPALPRTASRDGALPSCEAAIASASQDIDFSRGNGAADLPTSAIAAVLENGAWLGSCDVPTSTSLDVCVAIRAGHVIGASVMARPANAGVAACVRNRAASLQFPYSTHVDIARTRF